MNVSFAVCIRWDRASTESFFSMNFIKDKKIINFSVFRAAIYLIFVTILIYINIISSVCPNAHESHKIRSLQIERFRGLSEPKYWLRLAPGSGADQSNPHVTCLIRRR